MQFYSVYNVERVVIIPYWIGKGWLRLWAYIPTSLHFGLDFNLVLKLMIIFAHWTSLLLGEIISRPTDPTWTLDNLILGMKETGLNT